MTKEAPDGYNGKILRVNLSQKSTTTETLDELFCRRYIGGAGFITYFLWKELKPGIDPLSPDNKLIFALGPVSGLHLPGAGRHCVGAKAPITGRIGYAEAAGFWAAELKRARYDAIIIEGKAETPVFLWVQDGEASIKNADHLWGKETRETQDIIREELGDDKIQVAMIGPGGENLVRYTCIMHGLHNAAGRGGLGAVMGSKNLKAVAVRGHNLPKIADRERLKEIRQAVLANPHPQSKYGRGGPEMLMFEQQGDLPIRNFRDGLFPEVQKINAIVMKDTGLTVKMQGCYACPIRCKKIVQIDDEKYYVDPAYGGAEYETLAALGSNCGIDNLKAICKGGERCNAYTIDTISTGGVIAFTMECFERGILTKSDTGGLDLKFGNAEAMLAAIELIARRQGFGDLMAEGVARMASVIGNGSEEFAMHTKGLETAMHEPRREAGTALGLMLGVNLNGQFLTNEAMIKQYHPLGILEPLADLDDIGPRKVGVLKLLQYIGVLADSLVLCVVVPYNWENQIAILKAATGWDTGIVELMRFGERVITTSRLFNVREGFTSADDVLPSERFFQPKTDGILSNTYIDRAKMEKAKHFYYSLMGWDDQGVPLPEKVDELEIA